MSEIIKEFEGKSLKECEKWYLLISLKKKDFLSIKSDSETKIAETETSYFTSSSNIMS